jgi:hypothetical protein
MNTRAQLVCAWCAIAFAVIFTIGLWPLAGMMPPIAPSLTEAELADFYASNTLSIRFGVLVMMSSIGLMLPLVAVIAVQMKRIEGEHSVLTYGQISSGSLNALIFVVATTCWTVAAFRPDRDPQLVMLLNDFGWIVFLMTFTTFITQNFCIGFCVLSDKREEPIFPRWFGFYNFWVAVSFIPGGLLTFFKTGPFAWNGLFVWWIPFLMFFGWYIVTFVMVRKAVIRQSEESDGLAATA